MDINDVGAEPDDNAGVDWDEFQFYDSGYEFDTVEEGGDKDNGENGDDTNSEGGRDDFYPSDADIPEPTVWDSDEYFTSENSDSGEDMEKEKLKSKNFREVDTFHPKFEVGQRYSSKTLLREAIKSHAAETRRDLKVKKNDKGRMHIKCCGNEKKKKVNPCTWLLHALKVEGEETFRVSQFNCQHTCMETSKVRIIKSSWLANRYLDHFKEQPNMAMKGFRMMVRREMGFRAKSRNTPSIPAPSDTSRPSNSIHTATPILKQPLSQGPSIYQQLIGGVSKGSLSQNIRIDNARIHMSQSFGTEVISAAQLEKLRNEKRENIKRGKKSSK